MKAIWPIAGAVVWIVGLMAFANADTLDNGLTKETPGYFEVDIGADAVVRSGHLETGRDEFGTVDLVHKYEAFFVSEGAGARSFTGAIIFSHRSLVTTAGSLRGPNGWIDFTCRSWIGANGVELNQRWIFESALPFGSVALVQYFDENIWEGNNDILLPVGDAVTSPLQLYTLDSPLRVGSYQSFSTDTLNVTFEGWAAHRTSDLEAAISNGSAFFSREGAIDTAKLSPIPDTLPMEYGPTDISTGMKFTLASTATIARVQTIVGASAGLRSMFYDAIKIKKLSVKNRENQSDSFNLKAGYNWSGAMPPDWIEVNVGGLSESFVDFSGDMKQGYQFGNKQFGGKIKPYHHLLTAWGSGGGDHFGPGWDPMVEITMTREDLTFHETRQSHLHRGKYKEDKHLEITNYYVDRLKIKNGGTEKKDKILTLGTLYSTEAAADKTGLTVRFNIEDQILYEGNIPAADLKERKNTISYLRPKKKSGGVKSFLYNEKKKSFKIQIDGALFEYLPEGDHLIVGILVGLDYEGIRGGGRVEVQAPRKKGQIKF